jgi:hypothetical protein
MINAEGVSSIAGLGSLAHVGGYFYLYVGVSSLEGLAIETVGGEGIGCPKGISEGKRVRKWT